MQAARRAKKKRAARANSNVFARFDQDQIAEFKEVFKATGLSVKTKDRFSLLLQYWLHSAELRLCVCFLQAFEVIDTNNDGFITREDLKEILASLCIVAVVILHIVFVTSSRVEGFLNRQASIWCDYDFASSWFTAPKEPTEAEIDDMMAAAPDGVQKINWIMFLTMFAEKMDGAYYWRFYVLVNNNVDTSKTIRACRHWFGRSFEKCVWLLWFG